MGRYRVTGPLAVFGRRVGDEFVRDLTPGQERALIDGGHIEIAGPPPRLQPPRPPRAAQLPHPRHDDTQLEGADRG